MKKGMITGILAYAAALAGGIQGYEGPEPREHYVENRHRNIPLTKKQSRARAASRRAKRDRRIEFLNRK